jgi:tetratricopeptide (TPR) repeat protein
MLGLPFSSRADTCVGQIPALSVAAEGALPALYKERRYPEVRAIVDGRLIRDPEDHEAIFFSGMLALEVARDPDEAIALIEKAIVLAPKVASYHVGLGAALGIRTIRSGLFDAIRFGTRVKGELLAGVELDPRLIEGRRALALFYLLAPWVAGGSAGRAREQAIELSRIDAGVGALVLGQVEEREERHDQAEALYRKAVAAARGAPGRSEALIRLGYLLLHERRIPEALLAFEEAACILPREPNTHDSLADAYLANGEVEAAIASYRRALEENPRFESSLLGLARIDEGQANNAEASAYDERSRSRAPGLTSNEE